MQGCSVERRSQRHLKKAIRLNPDILKKDTILIHDTITTEEVKHDTVINLKHLLDTFYLQKDKLSIKMVKVHDSIWIEGKCDSDTIYFKKEVPVDKIIYKNYPKSIQKLVDWWWIVLIAIGVLVLLFRRK